MNFKLGDECKFISSGIKCIILEPLAHEPLRPGQVYIHNLFLDEKYQIDTWCLKITERCIFNNEFEGKLL